MLWPGTPETRSHAPRAAPGPGPRARIMIQVVPLLLPDSEAEHRWTLPGAGCDGTLRTSASDSLPVRPAGPSCVQTTGSLSGQLIRVGTTHTEGHK